MVTGHELDATVPVYVPPLLSKTIVTCWSSSTPVVATVMVPLLLASRAFNMTPQLGVIVPIVGGVVSTVKVVELDTVIDSLSIESMAIIWRFPFGL